MVSSFFKKSIQLLMKNLSGKMILKVQSFTRTVNLTHAKFWFVSLAIKKLFVTNKLSHNDGRILILDVDIDDENVILINLYNPNTKSEQLKTLLKRTEMLSKLHLTQNNNIICTRDFNLLINVNLESYGENPVLQNVLSGKHLN